MSVTILDVADLGGLELTVECAFGESPESDPTAWSWTDITASVLVAPGIVVTRGRSDEASDVEPSKLTLTLDNSDGRFTPENVASPYYPDVVLRVPIRVVLDGSTRFSGFVDEWPLAWPATVPTVAEMRIIASGWWRVLAQAPPLRSLAEELLGTFLEPSSYYPMTDGPAALAFADRSGHDRPAAPVTSWLPGGADWTQLDTNPADGGVDRKPAAFYPSTLPLPVGGPQTLTFVGHAPNTSASFHYYCMGYAADQQIADLLDSTGAVWRIHRIGYDLTLSRVAGDTSSVVVSLGNIVPNPVLIQWIQTGPNLQVTLWTPIDDATTTLPSLGVPTIVSATLYPVENIFEDQPFAGHVALYDSSPGPQQRDAIHDAFVYGVLTLTAAPLPTPHFILNPSHNPESWLWARALLVGYHLTQIRVDDATDSLLDPRAPGGVLGGQNPLAALRAPAAGALGVLYETLDGGLGFRGRSSRYVTEPWLTVSVADLAAAPEPILDDQGLVNDATVTRRQGQGRYVDQESVDSIGRYATAVDSLGFQADTYSLDFSATQQAAWIVNTAAKPRVRVPRLSLRISARSAVAAGWADGEPIGSWLRVTDLPAQMGDDTLDLFVEGYTETITPFSWTADINCSPVDPYNRLWELEADGNAGRLDLDGQTLAAARDSTQTTWSVATAAGKPLLTVDPTMVPFDIDAAGERVTITAVSGASSPQTVTVTRSVNGVVKAHSSGTRLRLWRPGVLKI